jgi:hypothetical protein
VRQLSTHPLGTRQKYINRDKIMGMIKFISVLIISSTTVYSQDIEYMKAYHLADSLIKITLGPTYDPGGVLDVDYILRLPLEKSQSEGIVFEDSYHQLQHCIIFCYSSWDSDDVKERYGSGVSLNDSGGVAIIRDGRIIWNSKRLICGYTDAGSRILGFSDLDNDGTTDIICSMGGVYSESLWLISPNQQGGRLLNATDQIGYSVIDGLEGTFRVLDMGKNHIKEIHATRIESDEYEKVIYTLQGTVFKEKNN